MDPSCSTRSQQGERRERSLRQLIRVARFALPLTITIAIVTIGCSEPVDPLEEIRKQHAAGAYAATVEPLRALLVDRPDDAELNLLYGRALVATQRPDLAVWSLRKALADPQWLAPAGNQLAVAALSARDFHGAIEITSRVLASHPDDLEALLLRANAHAHGKGEGDPEVALVDAARVLELDPDAIEAYEPRILALLALDRDEEASEALAEVGERLVELEAAPSVLAWHCSTKATFLQADGLPSAREAWETCLEKHPVSMEVLSGAVGYFDEQGDFDRSLAVMATAYETASASRPLRIMLADRMRAMGRATEAEALLMEATANAELETAAAAWMDVAGLHTTMQAYGAAADALEKALGYARGAGAPNPELLFSYADALVLAGRFDQAFAFADELTVPAHRHLIRARVAQQRRSPEEALSEYTEALLLWPDNVFARYFAGAAAEEIGDFDRAIAEYQYALRIAPGATEARTRLAAILLAERMPMAAHQILTMANDQAPLDLAGQLMLARVIGFAGDMEALRDALQRLARTHPESVGRAMSDAALGVRDRMGAATAMTVLATGPLDYRQPVYAEALLTFVQLAHESGELGPAHTALAEARKGSPGNGAFEAIRAFDLELSGAPAAEVRAAYDEALELWPGNAWTLQGLARLSLADDPKAAADLFDQAAAANPHDPEPKRAAIRALVAAGQLDAARQRLDALLLDHPVDMQAATDAATMDLERGAVTAATRERAERAVRFGGGADALELLSRVHEALSEPELAAGAAERAQALRDSEAS